ncbi:MAG: carbohydrate ABC transporter permease [Gammaproteobacteria bacterium]
MSERGAAVAVNAALAVAAVLCLVPLWWMLVLSLSPAGAAGGYPPPLWPRAVTLDHYRALVSRMDMARHFANSLAIAGAVTVLSVAFNTAAGYAFAKLRFAGRERLFRVLLFALVIPGQVAMLPLFILVKELGLVNSYAGVVVPGMASVFGIFLVRQYVQSIPDSLLDAARLDGAGEMGVFLHVVLPLCRPIIATLALFTFLGSWSDFLWPLIVLADGARYPLPVALANLLGEHAQDTELMMAGAVLTVAPVIALFLFLQRHYLAGLQAGALKG